MKKFEDERQGGGRNLMVVRKSVAQVQFPLNSSARYAFYRDDLLRIVDRQKILRNRILCPIAERGCVKAFTFTNPSLLFTKPTSLLCNLCTIHFFFLPLFFLFLSFKQASTIEKLNSRKTRISRKLAYQFFDKVLVGESKKVVNICAIVASTR